MQALLATSFSPTGLDLLRDRRKLRELIGVQLQATALFERLISREKRILKRLHATPAGAAYILAGRIVPALLIGLVQTGLLLSLAVFAFGVHIVGNILILIVAALFGALVFISFGFFVSSVSRNAESAENLTGLGLFAAVTFALAVKLFRWE